MENLEGLYRSLAEKLNEIPNGFPPTESGVELKLLAKLFSPEQARLATGMSLEHQSIGQIAERNNLSEQEAKSLLIGMVKKGLIEMRREQGVGFVFYLIPFVVGFYEKQNAKIDKEFAEYFEAYYKEAFYKTMITDPSVHRIIPVERTIPVNIDVMPYEKASTYIDDARSWGVLNCICRVQQKLIGKGCDHPVENCLVFAPSPGFFDRNEDIRAITKEEALEILAEADREGLVHSINNAQNEVNYICNCCTCSCGVLRSMVEHGCKHSIASSDFYAIVDESLCSGCELCLERCQFNAIEIIEGVSHVDKTECYGCGLCITSCTEQAIHLVQKNPEELSPPPVNDGEWRKKKEKSRIY